MFTLQNVITAKRITVLINSLCRDNLYLFDTLISHTNEYVLLVHIFGDQSFLSNPTYVLVNISTVIYIYIY